eukprot:CAMPEP_0113690270 /NCGR_PEP_ID=MMETSP0038_2-20120614/17681_1 /TAXON_ID=2898 /ORGANISM="Cryptomonas paramecium" /LENGTH=226 /DNA_ID=CAMNT_0000611543 /DNA_START=92 /DNA_END=770 /DNA_ORIENTATION=- /assembly_acc=CAM_ASM_000170
MVAAGDGEAATGGHVPRRLLVQVRPRDDPDPAAEDRAKGAQNDAVDEGCEEEFVRVVIGGKSFVHHQIRKMVGLALAILHGHVPEGCLEPALAGRLHFPAPLAPAEPLLLSWNSFWDERRDRWFLDFPPTFAAAAKDYKFQVLYPHVAALCRGTQPGDAGVFDEFLRGLPAHFDSIAAQVGAANSGIPANERWNGLLAAHARLQALGDRIRQEHIERNLRRAAAGE